MFLKAFFILIGKGLALISLDITGAFDRAWHTAILHALHQKECPTHLLRTIKSFLTNRTATLYYNKGFSTHDLSQSTPQGAILSPFLWNVFIDSLLTSLTNKGFQVQAYTDDICILIPYNRNQILALQQEIDKAINAAIEWGDAHKVLSTIKPPLFSSKKDSHHFLFSQQLSER